MSADGCITQGSSNMEAGKGSIILIGMPGAGKSTVGPILAEKLGLSFMDTDAMIKSSDGRELKTIVAEDGFEAFLDIQQRVLMSHDINNCVVATGGSVVRSSTLMDHLRSSGITVYLKNDFDILEMRLKPDRKLARAGGQTFRQVFEEREPLYIKYADSIINCSGKTPEEIALEIEMLYYR